MVMRASDMLAALGKIGGGKLTDSDTYSVEFYDTGIYLLNFMYSGSMFGGCPSKIVAMVAPEHTGKSYIGYMMARTFLREDPEHIIIFFETEGAIDKDKLVKLIGKKYAERIHLFGVDDKVNVIETFMSKAANTLELLFKSYDGGRSKYMIIVDSYGAFISEAELNMIKEKDMSANWITPKLCKTCFKSIAPDMATMKIPVFITGHVYDNVMGGKHEKKQKMSGGSAIKYFCTNIYEGSKVKNQEDPEGGITIRFRPYKSRYCSTNFKMDIDLMYKTGIDRCSGLLTLLAEEKLITSRKENRSPITNYKSDFLDIGFTSKDLKNSDLDDILGKERMVKIDEYLKVKYVLESTDLDDVAVADDEESINIEKDIEKLGTMSHDDMINYIRENEFVTINIKEAKKTSPSKLKKEIREILVNKMAIDLTSKKN